MKKLKEKEIAVEMAYFLCLVAQINRKGGMLEFGSVEKLNISNMRTEIKVLSFLL